MSIFSNETNSENSPGIHITLWCEYPRFGTGSDINEYFTTLLNFINANKIDRIIFRGEDPRVKPQIYTIGSSNIESSGALIQFIAGKQFQSTECEVYIVPWINNNNPWGYPLAQGSPNLPSRVTSKVWSTLNNIQKSVLWVQMVNEYLRSVNIDFSINGIVYEEEDSGIWSGGSGKKKALLMFQSALTSYIKPPSPQYSNDSSSQFKLASASQFNFYTYGTNVYLHEIYPQYYNLTNGTNPMHVDATSSEPWLIKGGYTPVFPNTIYTDNIDNMDNLVTSFADLIKPNPAIERPGDIHYMFSAETAPAILKFKDNRKFKNSFNKGGTTITGIDMISSEYKGTINAFGTQGYNWSKFLQFISIFGQEYNSSNFAIFQFNLIPDYWNQTEE